MSEPTTRQLELELPIESGAKERSGEPAARGTTAMEIRLPCMSTTSSWRSVREGGLLGATG